MRRVLWLLGLVALAYVGSAVVGMCASASSSPFDDAGIKAADSEPSVAAPTQTSTRDGERLVWLIWGRRGKGSQVAPLTVSWPQGLSWPGDGVNPTVWGEIVLGGAGETPAPASDVLVAPMDETGATCNGVLGPEEWDFGNALALDTPAGPLLISAKWTGKLLYVAAALPATSSLVGRFEAILTLAPSDDSSNGLPSSARATAVGWDVRREISTTRRGEPAGRDWRWVNVSEGATLDQVGVRGALSPKGDGSLRFVAAEYVLALVPLVQPSPGSRLRAALFITNLPPKHESTDAVRWPWGWGVAVPYNEAMISEHPDGWGVVRPGGHARSRGELCLPELLAAPVLDGQIGDGEWQGAAVLRDSVLGSGLIELRAGLKNGRFFLAMVCHTLRRNPIPQQLEVYLDPVGDGGLLPRDDDRLVLLTAPGGPASLMSWKLPPSQAGQKVVTPEGQWQEAKPSRAEGMIQARDNQVVAEVAIPLDEIGLAQDALPETFRLMARLVYDSELTIEVPKR